MRGEDVVGLSIISLGVLVLVYAFIQRMSTRKWGENPSGIGQIFKNRMSNYEYYEGEIFAIVVFILCMVGGAGLGYLLYPFCKNC